MIPIWATTRTARIPQRRFQDMDLSSVSSGAVPAHTEGAYTKARPGVSARIARRVLFRFFRHGQRLAQRQADAAQHGPFAREPRAFLDHVHRHADLPLGGPADRQDVALADADADVGVEDPLTPLDHEGVADLLDLHVRDLFFAAEVDVFGLVVADDL